MGEKIKMHLNLRTQKLTVDSKGYSGWSTCIAPGVFEASETAVLICDMWDKHWSRGAEERGSVIALKINGFIKEARKKGVSIIHSPSDTIGFYSQTKARQRMLDIPHIEVPKPIKLEKHPLPINDSDGGSDTGEKAGDIVYNWSRQTELIEIDDELDVISDDGREVYKFLKYKGIKNLLIVGVHTNMCILHRSFGIKQMVEWGINTVLLRDLTDSMYNPAMPPYVSHDEGTKLVVEYIEKFWCPSALSDEVYFDEKDSLVYWDVTEKPFEISGFPWMNEDGQYCRIRQTALNRLSKDLNSLAWCTSGGMVRFRTDSRRISIRAELSESINYSHMPASGTSGFDFYKGAGKDKSFVKNIRPEGGDTIVAGEIGVPDGEPDEWTLYFPLYNGVKKLELGFEPGARLEKPVPFAIENPVVFYGSSITHGGCASRPGNPYTHIICRWLDAKLVNLGFSGSAKGEPEVAELIASLDMSVFVLDYDHNAPNLEHLKKTHEPFFKLIRAAKPDLPVIFVSRPDFDPNPEENRLRKDIIYATYRNAVASGDKNVIFVDGEKLFGVNDRDACTVDGCHPNDLGFLRMAEEIYPAVKKALGLQA